MNSKEFLLSFIALLIKVFLPVNIYAQDELGPFDAEYPVEAYGIKYFTDSFGTPETIYFRVNPANPEEAVIFDRANEDDPDFESLTDYRCLNFETPEIVTMDGQNLIPTIIEYGTANYSPMENIKVTSNIRHISRYSFNVCPDLKNLIFEEGLTFIGGLCFNHLNDITELTLPNSLYSIGKNDFTNAENLRKITFGKGLREIGDYGFSDNISLTEVVLPEYLHRLGIHAFDNCTNLRRVTIPRWIKESYNNFNNCPNIEVIDLYCESDLADFYGSFDKVDKEKCIVIVPKGTSARFKNSYGVFSKFKNIIERDDEDVTTAVNTLKSASDLDAASSPKSAERDSGGVYSLSGVKYESVDNIPTNEIYIVTNPTGSSLKKIKH